MALFDLLFLALVSGLLCLSLFGGGYSTQYKPRMVLATWLLLLLGLGINGFKWQLLPAYSVFLFQSLSLLRNKDAGAVWKILGALPAVPLLLVSCYLSLQFPIIKVPAPSGQYAVGTFDYSISDATRPERFDPIRQRELYVEVWYPASLGDSDKYDKRTLWQELYSGSFDLVSLLTLYLSRVETHSHIAAPVAQEGRFPILVFNHGMFLFTSQNTQLMEHLASHGYVILSIAHPFESLKVNLESAGPVLASFSQAPDIAVEPGLPAPGFSQGLESLVGTPVSLRYEELHRILDGFREFSSESDRRNYVAEVITNRSAYDLPPAWQEEYLYNYLISELSIVEKNVSTWVEDIAFVLDEIRLLENFSPGFTASVDVSTIGIMGMSFGGAAAGEFCKTDIRCKAGSNIDGFQFGEHWQSPLLSPFLYVYSKEFAGNTDWAYLQSAANMHIYSIDESNHVDLTELVYSLPILRTIGRSGGVPSESAIEILNALHLRFFDQHLKNGPAVGEIETEYPQLDKRQLHQ